MKILIAFDKFKGSLSAAAACEVAERVLSTAQPESSLDVCPLSDGGEGFASILARTLGGDLREVEVPGPLFEPAQGKLALLPCDRIPEAAWKRLNLPAGLRSGTLGIIEMASASGYELLDGPARNPWETSTYGTGVLMQEAIKAGADALLLGIGGSATNDCGAGALEALGVCYYDRTLQPVTRVRPSTFRLINNLGSTSHLLDHFPPVRIACDVANPLLGPEGATAVFGPQKGLLPEDAERMERTVRKMGTRILGLFGKKLDDYEHWFSEPGAGAAGGIGFALRHALPDATFVEGFALFADLTDLPAKAQSADLILTGEGRLDNSSLSGKGPVGLLALGSGATLRLFAGSVEEATAAKLQETYPQLKVIRLSDPSWPLEKALAATEDALGQAVGREI
jgi:glycerate kinase